MHNAWEALLSRHSAVGRCSVVTSHAESRRPSVAFSFVCPKSLFTREDPSLAPKHKRLGLKH